MPENPTYFGITDGWYENPTKPIEHPARVAVIMATFVRNGKMEVVGGRRRDAEYIGKENEHISFIENKLDLIQFTLAAHKHYDPGVEYDLIIVDNSTDDIDSVQFLSEYCTKNGIQFIQRPNTGFSFGAYNHAWKTFGRKYDYYLFHEQDIVPSKDGWLKEILLRFLSDKNIGAVGNMLEGYRGRDYFENWSFFRPGLVGAYWNDPGFRQCNLDGAFMFTSSRILEECGLQVFEMKLTNDKEYESWDETPGINELFWQHPILDAGYKLASFADNKHRFTNGIQYVDFGTLTGEFSPMIHGQTLYCNKIMREHFDWYPLEKFKYQL